MNKKNEIKEEKKIPIKKQSFSLQNYKAEKKLNDGTKDKPISYIPVSKALREAIGSDIPAGYVTLLIGHSSVGKSTALIECAVGSQRIGSIPVIIDCENSWNFQHAKDMGFEFEEIIDEKTGEVTGYDGFFIYINNDYLIEHYGKKIDKHRDEATVENIAECINNLLDDQKTGKLPYSINFLLDSIGSLNCEKALISKSANNMWTAGALSVAFQSILNHRIPASRKEGKEYTNTFIAVNKIWLDSQTGNLPTVRLKGGTSIFFASRLCLHFGGVMAAATKPVKAISKGLTYFFGTETKVSVKKNHVTGVSYVGSLVATPHGFIRPDEINEYVKKHKDYLLSKLGLPEGDISVEIEDVETDD